MKMTMNSTPGTRNVALTEPGLQPEGEEPLPLLDVALPAGGRVTGEFARQAGTDIKALIRLDADGPTILEHTMTTLRATGRVGRIVVVGPEAVLSQARALGADGVVAEGATGPENILRGLAWLGESGTLAARVLVVTTDLPFLTPQSVRRFLAACPPDADVAIPIVTQQAYEARFPGSPNTFARLRDGAFTLGCVFLLEPRLLLQNRARLERLFAARKSQWRMVSLVGLPTLLRWMTGRLAVAHIVARAGAILGCRGAAVLDAPPELAFDIDLPEDFAHARSLASASAPASVVSAPVASDSAARSPDAPVVSVSIASAHSVAAGPGLDQDRDLNCDRDKETAR